MWAWLVRIFEPKASDSSRFERLEAKVRNLEDENVGFERRIKHVELDWDATYDKFMHLSARITKRQKTLDRENAALAAQEAPTVENGAPVDLTPSPMTGTHGRLAEMRKRVFGGGR